jgi:hypothetical protein
VAPLPAEALGLGHGEALDAGLGEGLLHLVDAGRLDDGGDQLHDASNQFV